VNARRLALEALGRIDEGAYANLVLGSLLERSGLDERDRRLATELVYGTTRLRRALDFTVDRFRRGEVEEEVGRILRLGAYQIGFTDIPDHAAVGETVDLAPHRARGLVNAVLRKVAASGPVSWPDLATKLSYPDWVVARLEQDLGPEDAHGALAAMNVPAEVTERPDGYIQDLASQWVADYVGGSAPDLVADVCAAPGGKATALAASGAAVVAGDRRASRAGLISDNAERLGLHGVSVLVADAGAPALRRQSFPAVLVDAPCSGLGVLRRRPDARWRIDPAAPPRLGQIQKELLSAAAALVAPGGRLYFSVCTLSAAETIAIDEWCAGALPSWEADPVAPPSGPWRSHGRGWMVLPQDAGTDGMYVLALASV
jgi:16S rRNA (cytosine967-C5)-methyltransferase